MLKSMTGFGRGVGETALGNVTVEVRSVNHRYGDISLKLPKRLFPFEARIKELLRSEISRGRVDLSVKLETPTDAKVAFEVDLPLADQYYQVLQSLKEHLGLKDTITLDLIAGAKDVIRGKEESEDVEPFWQEMVPILKQSLKAMDDMKQLEGQSLGKDIEQRFDLIDQHLTEIKKRFPATVEASRDRLHERLRTLLAGMEVDPGRFQQEVAFLAERTDITEEIVRAESHLVQFRSLLIAREPVGRKMDFLLQEIHREVNTIGSKANDAEISQRVVDAKGELEKVREQVQNLE